MNVGEEVCIAEDAHGGLIIQQYLESVDWVSGFILGEAVVPEVRTACADPVEGVHRLILWYLPVYPRRVYVGNSSTKNIFRSHFNPPPAKIKSSPDSPK